MNLTKQLIISLLFALISPSLAQLKWTCGPQGHQKFDSFNDQITQDKDKVMDIRFYLPQGDYCLAHGYSDHESIGEILSKMINTTEETRTTDTPFYEFFDQFKGKRLNILSVRPGNSFHYDTQMAEINKFQEEEDIKFQFIIEAEDYPQTPRIQPPQPMDWSIISSDQRLQIRKLFPSKDDMYKTDKIFREDDSIFETKKAICGEIKQVREFTKFSEKWKFKVYDWDEFNAWNDVEQLYTDYSIWNEGLQERQQEDAEKEQRKKQRRARPLTTRQKPTMTAQQQHLHDDLMPPPRPNHTFIPQQQQSSQKNPTEPDLPFPAHPPFQGHPNAYLPSPAQTIPRPQSSRPTQRPITTTHQPSARPNGIYHDAHGNTKVGQAHPTAHPQSTGPAQQVDLPPPTQHLTHLPPPAHSPPQAKPTAYPPPQAHSPPQAKPTAYPPPQAKPTAQPTAAQAAAAQIQGQHQETAPLFPN